MIIAGSVGVSDGAGGADASQISDFSNRAGSGRDHYMVAPGEAISVLYMGAIGVGEGTSFSAPLISGAAALILDRWPDLRALGRARTARITWARAELRMRRTEVGPACPGSAREVTAKPSTYLYERG